jgi:hypothetical protein
MSHLAKSIEEGVQGFFSEIKHKKKRTIKLTVTKK